MLQLIGVSAELVVEGDGGEGVGPVRGRVVAIALDDQAGRDAADPSADTTWLLVADEQHPGPVWVTQDSITSQRLGR